MSYRTEREQFIARMTQEGMHYQTITALLRAATTLQRYAELSCSSEEADRDRVPCPASTTGTMRIGGVVRTFPRKPTGPCLCDRPNDGHETIPRITLLDWRVEQRVKRLMPEGWSINTQGDPRGYVLRVIPPSYAERNAGRDVHNLDAIGVPSGPSGLRF